MIPLRWDYIYPNLPLVFLHIVKVVSTDNDGSHHLGTVASTRQDAAPDGNIAGKGAFLVYERSCKAKQQYPIKAQNLFHRIKIILHKITAPLHSSHYNS